MSDPKLLGPGMELLTPTPASFPDAVCIRVTESVHMPVHVRNRVTPHSSLPLKAPHLQVFTILSPKHILNHFFFINTLSPSYIISHLTNEII